MISSKGLNVTAIPEIANFFAASKNIFYCNGRTHFLLRTKSINNKRKLHEMEVDTIEVTKEANNNLAKKIKEMEKAIDEHKRRENLFLQDKEKLVKLYQLGNIDSNGEYIGDD